nr:zinc finger, CCHC-type [Tanacetum cinerariifolium]
MLSHFFTKLYQKSNYFKSQNTKLQHHLGCLKIRHIGEERVQQARLQTLKCDFEILHMKENETIDTFIEKLTTLVNKAASLGHPIEDQTLVRKLLNAIPDRYLQIVASIEQYSDLSEMTLEEAVGRLKTYEERIKYKKGKQVDNQEKLMFTRHENKEKYFRGHGRGKHKFSQGRNYKNFKEERKEGETSHRSLTKISLKKSRNKKIGRNTKIYRLRGNLLEGNTEGSNHQCCTRPRSIIIISISLNRTLCMTELYNGKSLKDQTQMYSTETSHGGPHLNTFP